MTHLVAMPAEADDIAQRVELARSRVFFGHAIGNMASVLIGWIMLVFVMHSGGVSDRVLHFWSAPLLILALIVSIYDRKVDREGIDVSNYRRRVRMRSFLGIAVVSFYGVAGMLLPEGRDTMLQDTFLFIVMSAVVTISVLSYAVMPFHYILLGMVSVVPLTLTYLMRYLQSDNNYYLMLAALSVIWQVLVARKALRISHNMIEGIALNERLQQEIEEHMRTRESIRHLAMHDYLTDLANRRQFEENTQRALKVCDRDTSKLGLLAIDLDDFKPVNDRHGHAVGDQLLIAVAGRLKDTLRASDFAARMGGDEFAAVIHNVRAGEDVLEVVAKLREVLCEPYSLAGHTIRVGASIGWAVYPDDGEALEPLLGVADQRMYADKQQRKHQAA